MQPTGIPSSTTFYHAAPIGAAPPSAPRPEAPPVATAYSPPPPPPPPQFTPLLPEDSNLKGMTQRALQMALGERVDLVI